MKYTAYDPNGLSQDTTRGPSKSVWKDFPTTDVLAGCGGGDNNYSGGHIFDDFDRCGTPTPFAAAAGFYGPWSLWSATGSAVTDAAEEGGVAKIDGTTANKSFLLASNATSIRLVGKTPGFAMRGKFWMEFRIALGSVAASQQGIFIGLADATGGAINASDTTVIASGGNTLTTTKNLFGFFNRTTTGPADWSVAYQPAAGTAVFPTGLTTLVNTVTAANMAAYAASSDVGQGTGFVKIGMVFDPTIDRPSRPAPTTCPATQTAGNIYPPTVSFYVNGQLVPAFLTKALDMQLAAFPNNCVFSPVFNYMNIAGGTAPVYLDWLRYGWLGGF